VLLENSTKLLAQKVTLLAKIVQSELTIHLQDLAEIARIVHLALLLVQFHVQDVLLANIKRNRHVSTAQ